MSHFREILLMDGPRAGYRVMLHRQLNHYLCPWPQDILRASFDAAIQNDCAVTKADDDPFVYQVSTIHDGATHLEIGHPQGWTGPRIFSELIEGYIRSVKP